MEEEVDPQLGSFENDCEGSAFVWSTVLCTYALVMHHVTQRWASDQITRGALF